MRKSLKGKKSSKPEVVFIDWNGTLSPSNFWIHLENSTSEKDRKLFKLWAGTMFINHKEKIIPWMKGAYTTEDILKLVAYDTNTDFNFLLKEFITGCEKMEYYTPRIPELVKKLRNKSVIIAIATNNMDSFTRWTVPAMKLETVFDDILNSFYLKAMKYELDEKGESLFFKKFFVKYQVNPSNCVFIDDGEDKMKVISGMGIDYRKLGNLSNLEQELTKILLTS